MDEDTCWHLTLSVDFSKSSYAYLRDDHRAIRRVWSEKLAKRLRKRYPKLKAWTFYEWKQPAGWHLHIVARGVSGITHTEVQDSLNSWETGIVACLKRVRASEADRHRVAHYVTKQIGESAVLEKAQRYFHQYTPPHDPARQTRKEWQQEREKWAIPGFSLHPYPSRLQRRKNLRVYVRR